MDGSGVNLPEGTVISGKYRVDHVLGQGGMGVVLLGFHIKLEEPVAIKVLLPQMARNEEVAQRFVREARTAVRIKSEHVVRVLDVDVLEDGTPYMVMERLRGCDLNDRLQQVGHLEVGVAARYLIQACDAMAAAHVLGIVHRDMKSANLFLANQDDHSEIIKVLDFGISKVPSDSMSGRSLTATQALLGTPLYMSPEQLQSTKSVDPRADIWGLGCVLFEMLTGELPFARNTLPELCTAILCEPAPRASSKVTRIPPEIDAIVAKCLEKSPATRYTTVFELANALLPFAPDMGPLVERIGRRFRNSHAPDVIAAGEARFSSASPATRITPVVTEQMRLPQPPKRGLRGLSFLAAALAILVAAMIWWKLRPVPIRAEAVVPSSVPVNATSAAPASDASLVNVVPVVASAALVETASSGPSATPTGPVVVRAPAGAAHGSTSRIKTTVVAADAVNSATPASATTATAKAVSAAPASKATATAVPPAVQNPLFLKLK